MMTSAYVAYCGPLTSDVQTKLDQEIQMLTPDQRWQLDQLKNSGYGDRLRIGSKYDLENYPPSAREMWIKYHVDACMDMEKRIDKALPPLATTPWQPPAPGLYIGKK
jgi:hypothetical protein